VCYSFSLSSSFLFLIQYLYSFLHLTDIFPFNSPQNGPHNIHTHTHTYTHHYFHYVPFLLVICPSCFLSIIKFSSFPYPIFVFNLFSVDIFLITLHPRPCPLFPHFVQLQPLQGPTLFLHSPCLSSLPIHSVIALPLHAHATYSCALIMHAAGSSEMSVPS
jgi:hypothetical protein